MKLRSPIATLVDKYYGTHIERGKAISYNKSVSQQDDMLEDIVVNHPWISAGVVGAVVSTILYPVALGYCSRYVERGSPKLSTEAQAHSHFERLKSHYAIADDEIELRCTYRGETYIRPVEGKSVVFLNMGTDNKKASIQHEILHYVNGDTVRDTPKKTALEVIGFWAYYFFVAEPRVLWQLHKNRID